jgi:sarcosine oxidase
MIDRHPDVPNPVYAGGFAGHDCKFSSVVGEILADHVTQGQATPDADFLRLRLRVARLTQGSARAER